MLGCMFNGAGNSRVVAQHLLHVHADSADFPDAAMLRHLIMCVLTASCLFSRFSVIVQYSSATQLK